MRKILATVVTLIAVVATTAACTPTSRECAQAHAAHVSVRGC